MINKVHHPIDYFGDYLAEVEDRYGRGKDFSISFLPELDDLIWGLRRKKLVIVAGRTSQGKSTLMLQMAHTFAKQHKNVFYFTLEMAKEDCLERFICQECSIDNTLMTTGKVKFDKEAFERMAQYHEKLKNYKVAIIESYGKTFKEINEVIQNFPKPDVVFIDYVNLIKDTSRSKKDSVDEYIKELRALAIEKDFCAVLGAQVNREAHKSNDDKTRSPDMWHLKESGSLEEHADMVFLVHWDSFYTRDEERKFLYQVKVAKNRGGKTGTFKCAIDPQYYRIRELDDVEQIRVNGNSRNK